MIWQNRTRKEEAMKKMNIIKRLGKLTRLFVTKRIICSGSLVTLLVLLGACSTPPEIIEVEVTREVIVTQPAPSFSLDSNNNQLIVSTMYDDAMDETFRIYVALPASYDQESTKTYPVLYVTDGNTDTELANLLVWNLEFINAVPEMIVVGFGYDSNEDEKVLDWRIRDLMPPDSIRPDARGDQMLSFVKDKLIPEIEQQYSTNPEQRYLAGFSAGGTFTLYSLFNAPHLFRGYIATSPSTVLGKWTVTNEARAFIETSMPLSGNVFVSWGSQESIIDSHIGTLVTLLEEAGYEDLDIRTAEFDGENHVTMWPVGLQRGLREMFR